MYGCPAGAPLADPTNVSLYLYGGGKIGVQWTNGDATCLTVIFVDGVEIDEATPGAENYDSALFSGTFSVAHRKNGILGAIVEAGA